MFIKSIFLQILLIGLVISLTACSNRVEDIAKRNGLVSFVGANSKGNPVVILPEGQVLPECRPLEPIESTQQESYGKKRRSDTSSGSCKTIVKRAENGEIKLFDSSRKEIKVDSIVEVIILNYPGSECVTHYMGGRQVEICR